MATVEFKHLQPTDNFAAARCSHPGQIAEACQEGAPYGFVLSHVTASGENAVWLIFERGKAEKIADPKPEPVPGRQPLFAAGGGASK